MDIDLYSCGQLLRSFKNSSFIWKGRQMHLLLFKRGVLGCSLVLGNSILQMYTRCNSMNDAKRFFYDLPLRNCFSWNTMIEGYLKSGHRQKSLEIFEHMPYKNDFTWNLVLSGTLKFGDLEVAHRLFNRMPRKNAHAWNSIIHGYTSAGFPNIAIKLFKYLASNPHDISCIDTFVLTTVIGVCANLFALGYGKQIHAYLVVGNLEFDSAFQSSLINFYGKCGDLSNAHNVFNSIHIPDEFSISALISGYAACGMMNNARRIFSTCPDPSIALWNSMISGLVANCEALEALSVFFRMREVGVWEDSSTVVSILSAYGMLGVLETCKQMHSHTCKIGFICNINVSSSLLDTYYKCGSAYDACKLFSLVELRDMVMLNTMITIYSNCGRIEDAKQVFQNMSVKSLISWNSILVGLNQNGCAGEALNLFNHLNDLGLRMDMFTLASAISTCGSISYLELGEQVFSRTIIIGLAFNHVICTSLIDFYSKCGLVENGRKLFDLATCADKVMWNSMLMGYAANGHGIEALKLFHDMLHVGVVPNDITCTAILSACDHCGLVEEARNWFNAMKHGYHDSLRMEHYSCLIDLFSRTGYVEEAVDLMEHMPFEADAGMRSSVLRGCVAHGFKSVGEKVAERIIELDPDNSSAYVQLCSMYAKEGDWEGFTRIRNEMRINQIHKIPGYSAADV